MGLKQLFAETALFCGQIQELLVITFDTELLSQCLPDMSSSFSSDCNNKVITHMPQLLSVIKLSDTYII